MGGAANAPQEALISQLRCSRFVCRLYNAHQVTTHFRRGASMWDRDSEQAGGFQNLPLPPGVANTTSNQRELQVAPELEVARSQGGPVAAATPSAPSAY